MENISTRCALAIRDSRHFVDAADVLLTELVQAACELLQPLVLDDPLSWTNTEVVAAAVWLRRDGVQRGRRRLRGEACADAAPSTTMWRLVTQVGEPVVAVRETEAFSMWRDHGLVSLRPASEERQDGFAERTRRLLVAGATTHILAWPVRDPAGIVGMVTLEVACPGFQYELEPLGPALLAGLGVLVTLAALLQDKPLAPVTQAPQLPLWAGQRMAEVLRTLHAYARFDHTILLLGPSGTGKSKLARWVHEQSRREGGPFVVVHSAAIPPSLFTAHMFGARRGTWTGLQSDMAGLVAGAEGGTLVLDDIHKAPLESQAALLQLLEDGTYRPLGEHGDLRQTDVRIVAATSADLEEEVRGGRFIPDLMFRLHDLVVEVPPLEERLDEIPAWAHDFAVRTHTGSGMTGEVRLDPATIEALRVRSWPGNLRSLESAVHIAYAHAAAESGGVEITIRPHHLPAPRKSARPHQPHDAVQAFEKAADAFILAAVQAQERGDEPLSHETWAQHLKSLVVLRAAAKVGRDEALRLLGAGTQVDQGNAARVLERARRGWEELRRRLEGA